ncbi:response regulator transcription factor [bacterium]|nr:response regulator transcription factor [bacterium]
MRIAIVEDERLSAEHLAALIKEIEPEAEIVAMLDSVAATVAWLRKNEADLLFLDIQLTDGQSFAIFEQIKIEVPVIFTTAYDAYAIRAFKVNSVDYLLKPIRKAELRAGLEKFHRLHFPAQKNLQQLIQALQRSSQEYKKKFLVQCGEKLYYIETSAIAFAYTLEKSSFLTTFDRAVHTVDFSLDQLQEMLDPDVFFRINRKLIVSYKAIKSMTAFSRSRIKLDLQPVPPKTIDALVSVERTHRFKEWIDK